MLMQFNPATDCSIGMEFVFATPVTERVAVQQAQQFHAAVLAVAPQAKQAQAGPYVEQTAYDLHGSYAGNTFMVELVKFYYSDLTAQQVLAIQQLAAQQFPTQQQQ